MMMVRRVKTQQNLLRFALVALISFCLGFSSPESSEARSKEAPKIRFQLDLERKILQKGFKNPSDPVLEHLRQIRVAHARELMGTYYHGSHVQKTEEIADIEGMIHEWVLDYLPPSYKRFSKIISKGILEISFHHRFDPIFVMSVIMTESSFRPKVRGTSGEWGLMQLMPRTGEWKARLLGLSWRGEKMLNHPLVNIQLGTAYLAYLRDKFDSHSQLYLAAYNMGQGNVNSALKRSIWPKDYPKKVMSHYLDFYERFVEELPENQLKTGRALAAKKKRAPKTFVIYEDSIRSRSSALNSNKMKLNKSDQKREARASDAQPTAL